MGGKWRLNSGCRWDLGGSGVLRVRHARRKTHWFVSDGVVDAENAQRELLPKPPTSHTSADSVTSDCTRYASRIRSVSRRKRASFTVRRMKSARLRFAAGATLSMACSVASSKWTKTWGIRTIYLFTLYIVWLPRNGSTLGRTSLSNPSPGRWFDLTAFRFGNSGRNILLGLNVPTMPTSACLSAISTCPPAPTLHRREMQLALKFLF